MDRQAGGDAMFTDRLLVVKEGLAKGHPVKEGSVSKQMTQEGPVTEQLVKERLVNEEAACMAFYHDNHLNTEHFGISKKNFDVDVKCSHCRPTSGLLCKLRHNWRAILVSALPFLVFLGVFATNKQTHLLPTADDVNRVTLYNVTTWEERLHIASFHKSISDFNSPPLDLLAAVPYLAHYAIPLVYPAVLIATDRLGVIPQFYRLIGFTMWFDLVIWSHFPTFPPWATDSSLSSVSPGHSVSNQTLHTGISLHLRQGAAFARVDNFTGFHIFRMLFSDNPVPFASFPSGHVTWPMCILLTLPSPLGLAHVAASVYVILVAWSTMYSNHHYLLDVIGAVASVILVERVLRYVTRMWAESSSGEERFDKCRREELTDVQVC